MAIVGGGPTAVYTLRGLVTDAPVPLHIDLFEKGPSVGPGMPYSAAMNDPCMLSNIASRELPPVVQPLDDWLRTLDTKDLVGLRLCPGDISETAFYPRLVLGAYFTAQMAELIALGRRRGHRVELHLRHEVTDLRPTADGINLDWRSPSGEASALYDEVVLASGHRWPDRTRQDGVTLLSPWPAEKIARLPDGEIGVLGSSLSAIDVAVTVASARGTFRDAQGQLVYEALEGRGDFRLTLMSRKGLLPEADFWYDLPLPELPALARVARSGEAASLTRAFDAFRADLNAADPAYLAALGGVQTSLETFCDAYFAARLAADPFDWAERNLTEAMRSTETRRAIPWRSALLRAHELFEELLPTFTEADLARFHATLKPVFTDCYACVPHASILRLLALHRSGHLEVLGLREEQEISRNGEGLEMRAGSWSRCFDVLIDARGQQPMTLADLGFPSLGPESLGAGSLRFEDFVLPLRVPGPGRIHCLALPVLLRRQPFVQGLVNACEMGSATADLICGASARPRRAG
ncbi:FAD/NAD(P)-binding protein [Salipiger pacificus]|uniref:FAD/NAD(P)-binding protein n=1 Tax=Salipiger mangrovisoli TaxID=2865933 RepID=A0ABR9X501_9RHOB|nr:FAD/NAD(P)-binding protein [Salipiger mangrovisoli]